MRGYSALYVGGMGSRTQNFYNDLAGRMGYAEAAAPRAGALPGREPREAAAAVPLEFVDATCLLGPAERIADGCPPTPTPASPPSA